MSTRQKKSIKLRTRFLISVLVGIIALIIAFPVSMLEPSGDTPEKIKEVEAAIAKEIEEIGREEEGVGGFRLVTLSVSWEKIKDITESLVYENKRIAKAKTLKLCQVNPIPDGSWEENLWDDRYEISSKDWAIQTLGSRILTSFGIAALSCLGCIIGVFMLLIIANWLWYFLLYRISELSKAIQGK